MSRGIAIMLVGAILCCPLVCAAGHVAARSASNGAAEHCGGCCDHRAESGGDSRPADRHSPRSGHSCQCVCGGALVDDAGGVVVTFDWNWSVPIVPVSMVAGQVYEAEYRQLSVAPWPDVGMNHGRALCCLYNTYLC